MMQQRGLLLGYPLCYTCRKKHCSTLESAVAAVVLLVAPTKETDDSSAFVAKHGSDCVDTGLLVCSVGSSMRRSCILMILLAASSSLRPAKDKVYFTGAPAAEMSTWALLTLSITSSDMFSSDSHSVHPAGGRQRRMECAVTRSCGSGRTEN